MDACNCSTNWKWSSFLSVGNAWMKSCNFIRTSIGKSKWFFRFLRVISTSFALSNYTHAVEWFFHDLLKFDPLHICGPICVLYAALNGPQIRFSVCVFLSIVFILLLSHTLLTHAHTSSLSCWNRSVCSQYYCQVCRHFTCIYIFEFHVASQFIRVWIGLVLFTSHFTIDSTTRCYCLTHFVLLCALHGSPISLHQLTYKNVRLCVCLCVLHIDLTLMLIYAQTNQAVNKQVKRP